MARVLVLGGGFGGLAAAHRLRERLPDTDEITVVDERDTFFPGLAKLWDVAGMRPLAASSRPLGNLIGKGIGYRQARILSLDPGSLSVETAEGTLAGDAIVIALGAAYRAGHLAMLENRGHNLYDATSIPAVTRALDEMQEGRVVIAIMGIPYKCPPAPYEAALLIEERLRNEGKRERVEVSVHTPQPSPLPVAGPDASATLAAVLGERNIELHPEHKVSAVEDDRILFGEDADRYSLLLGVPGHVAPALLVEAGLTGPSGWIEPDPGSMRTSFERVYAAGDCTHIPISIGALPKAGVFAKSEGLVAADNIAAELGHGAPSTLSGEGYCFLEFGGRTAAYVRGDFMAEPRPDVTISHPDEATFAAKEAFVTEHLERWL